MDKPGIQSVTQMKPKWALKIRLKLKNKQQIFKKFKWNIVV